MHGIVSYEERVRLERANGIRPKNECAPCGGGCTKADDPELVGLTYHDVGNMPQPLRRVCPHPKVIVPVTPAMIVNEPVKTLNPQMGDAKWRVADLRPCDARTQGLYAIGNDKEVSHVQTVIEAGTRVVDNPFDHAHEVKTITSKIEDVANPAQPVATTGTPVVPEEGTEDGKTRKKKSELAQEAE